MCVRRGLTLRLYVWVSESSIQLQSVVLSVQSLFISFIGEIVLNANQQTAFFPVCADWVGSGYGHLCASVLIAYWWGSRPAGMLSLMCWRISSSKHPRPDTADFLDTGAISLEADPCQKQTGPMRCAEANAFRSVTFYCSPGCPAIVFSPNIWQQGLLFKCRSYIWLGNWTDPADLCVGILSMCSWRQS